MMTNAELKSRWLLLCAPIGIDGGEMWRMLSCAYDHPARAYHNLNHIADCLLQFDAWRHLVDRPVPLEFAIWFHDLIYDTHAADNEERSAAAASSFLSGSGFGTDVADLILATKHDGRVLAGDAALLCDIDLSIFGRTTETYDAYAAAIRQEYSWVPSAEYIKGRTRVLEIFLSRSRIFRLDPLEADYGPRARENIRNEIKRLGESR